MWVTPLGRAGPGLIRDMVRMGDCVGRREKDETGELARLTSDQINRLLDLDPGLARLNVSSWMSYLCAQSRALVISM